MLTYRQKAVLVGIQRYQVAHGGASPSVRQLAAYMGRSSTHIWNQFIRLQQRGYIVRKRDIHGSRAIWIWRPPLPRVVYGPHNATFYRFNDETQALEPWHP